MFNYSSISALATDKITRFGSPGSITRDNITVGDTNYVIMSKTTKYDEFGNIQDVFNMMFTNETELKIGDVIGNIKIIDVSEYMPDGLQLLYYDAKGTGV